MLRLAFAFLLALCVSAQAQLSGGVGGFPGPGTPHTSASAPAYTYIGSAQTGASGSGITQSFALGSNPTCKAVVGVTSSSGTTPTVTVSVGGVSLVQDSSQSVNAASLNVFIFSKDLASCTGSQSVVMTSTAASFSYRSISVYVLTNTVTSTVVQIGGYSQNSGTRTPTSPTISVTAGDLMFAEGLGNGAATLTTCSGSSVAPNAINQVTGGSASNFMADWLIASTNASFATICDSSSNTNAVAFATYH